MSGVWIFDKKGTIRLVRNPTRDSFPRPRVLVYLPTNQVITSHAELEQKLADLGWTRYRNPNGSSELLQFHRSEDSPDLISLPKSFDSLRPLHMYDVVVKNRGHFKVCMPP